jgi:secondary thiamine-phosphate synthase enzyme
MTYSETIRLKVSSQEFFDITGKVEDIVRKSGIEDGICNVFVKGSTVSVIINENDPMLIEDLKRVLEKISSSKDIYQHVENAYSHIRSSLLGSSQSMPIREGKLLRGTWQSIMVANLDMESRDREVIITIVGD